jgi:outer membrane protein OmpA-like peptidoglycan-associated protein
VLDVGGHSSKEGTSEANLRLSVERAALVARYLRRQTGMREDRVRWTGYGELRPLIDDRLEVGRQENRRVEVRVFESRQR